MVEPTQTDWADWIPMVEFAMNSSVSASTGYAPFELNYGYLPRWMATPVGESPYRGVNYFAERARANLQRAHDAIIESRVNQTYYANKKRRDAPEYSKGQLVYLNTKNLNLPKGRAHKLLPKFVGPYLITKVWPNESVCELKLPDELVKRRIHPRFHVNLLRPHIASSDEIFPSRDLAAAYDFGQPDRDEVYFTSLVGHLWDGQKLRFIGTLSTGNVEWTSLERVRHTDLLRDYLALRGVTSATELPREPSVPGSALI